MVSVAVGIGTYTHLLPELRSPNSPLHAPPAVRGWARSSPPKQCNLRVIHDAPPLQSPQSAGSLLVRAPCCLHSDFIPNTATGPVCAGANWGVNKCYALAYWVFWGTVLQVLDTTLQLHNRAGCRKAPCEQVCCWLSHAVASTDPKTPPGKVTFAGRNAPYP